MQINGFQSMTLLDYPGHIAATVFCGGCNFRCPYCQNGDLVLHAGSLPAFSRETVLSHLKKRKNLLKGVCISGGEPTLQQDLSSFIKEIRELGYHIKLDTNGYRPDVLSSLLQEGLLDYIAMDIKHSPEKYNLISNVPKFDIEKVRESVQLIMESGISYEFRTTIIKEYHKEDDIRVIGAWLTGAKAYYLQSYKDSEQVISPGFSPCSKETLLHYRSLLTENIELVEIRGVD